MGPVHCILAAVLSVGAGLEAHPSEVRGSIHTWVIHFDPDMSAATEMAYDDLLGQLPGDVDVVVAVTSEEDAELFRMKHLAGGVHPPDRVVFRCVRRRVTSWARDRYIGGLAWPQTQFVVPRVDPERPERRADGHVAAELVAPDLVHHTSLRIDGGNVLFARGEALLSASALRENPGYDRRGLEAALGKALGRKAVVLGAGLEVLPHVHLDMFAAVVGPRHVLLGDPRLTRSYFERRRDLGIERPEIRELGTFDLELQEEVAASYDLIRDQLVARGYTVSRIPILHDAEGNVITWCNAVVDVRSGGVRRVYMPVYDIPYLDRLAAETWERLGFLVVPVRCEGTITLGGAVRCLTNVIRGPLRP